VWFVIDNLFILDMFRPVGHLQKDTFLPTWMETAFLVIAFSCWYIALPIALELLRWIILNSLFILLEIVTCLDQVMTIIRWTFTNKNKYRNSPKLDPANSETKFQWNLLICIIFICKYSSDDQYLTETCRYLKKQKQLIDYNECSGMSVV
jgi:hypothetical protein